MSRATQLRAFENEPASPEMDAAEKEAYRQRLREYLKDPEFRKIEGFPIGEDDAIISLSDPPYFTACPNPFLPEIIDKWQEERAELRKDLDLSDDSVDGNYHREPFAADVSEGKNHPVYRSFAYHTKVPHRAIMRYILHYTDPGDIVLDGFCGTGMTGVAVRECNDRRAIHELGYRSDDEVTIGPGRAVLIDLSPYATCIAANYNANIASYELRDAANTLVRDLSQECGWIYKVANKSDSGEATMDYMIWSEVFLCPNCTSEHPFSEIGFDFNKRKPLENIQCPDCGVQQGPNDLERSLDLTGKTKSVPIRVKHASRKRAVEIAVSDLDIQLISRIDAMPIPNDVPENWMMGVMPNPRGWGDMWRKGYHSGIQKASDFFNKRTLWVVSCALELVEHLKAPWDTKHLLRIIIVNMLGSMSKMRRAYQGTLPLVLYMPKMYREVNVIRAIDKKIGRLMDSIGDMAQAPRPIISTQSSNALSVLQNDTIDYIFTDPPFGKNIMYSEVNFIQESFLKVFTKQKTEAIMSKAQKKGLVEYRRLMECCFQEFHRVLKPGRWMTVEFHNSENTVWNAIQQALQVAKFVVADVRVLDKKQGSFKQVSTIRAVKQDLVISAYKPSDTVETQFTTESGEKGGVRAFIDHHLSQLPVVVKTANVLEQLTERQPHLLFDRMVAFYIQRGRAVPLSAPEFYDSLRQRLVERDGMFFLPEQAPEYDKARLEAGQVAQLTLFVSDEKTTIQWLRQQLDPALGGCPQTYQEIQPKFLRQLHQARHEVLPEPIRILEESFLINDKDEWYIPDPSNAVDLDELRQKGLLREFQQYLETKGRLRQFRSEAVRAGFADAYRRKDFDTILKIAERLPETVLQEDPDLLMYHDIASLRED